MDVAPPQPVSQAGEITASPRDRLIEAATRLFCRYGVNSVGVDEIVAAAGTAQTPPYRLFPSKDGLGGGVVDSERPAAGARVLPRNAPGGGAGRTAVCPPSRALGLPRVVREPLELDRKWMRKAHLTLRHDQACGILFGRNPPLRACASAPRELASRILMVEGRSLKYQRSREPVPPALKFPVSGKAYPHARR